ncbi:phospholipase D family protein [Lysinibacillus sp. NPDC056232]|uniref:phospholipase D family protein n=1 Tax=Lysinibacillus sp. NPDC056232 TaxID=3345756 RepID=UPI0035DF8F79
MTQYLWEKNTFYEQFKQTLSDQNIHLINITSAYISINGAKQLQALTRQLQLEKEDIQIYCSTKFNEQQPTKILEFLLTFATVYIVHEPFLHSKAYEVHSKNIITTYIGSANLTEGGMFNNNELMIKSVSAIAPLEEFWDYLWQNCISVNDEVITLYRELPAVEPSQEAEQALVKLNKKLQTAYEKQCIESAYPDLTGFYFNVDDYSIFNEEYWQSGSSEVRMKRKTTQEKFYELNEAIQSFAYRNDLHPHYKKEHLTSGIVPSIYNFERVTGIWMRYGKHKSELNPFGTTFGKKSSPIEQFHKHACLQLSIGSEGLNIGMFHSTANDGVDCHHVDEHWNEVKQRILNVYDKIKGYNFVWSFYNNRENRTIDTFEIDVHSADQFIKFYRKYDMLGYESFCMRYYETDDPHIKTYKNISHEVSTIFDAIMPLYQAMTFRIPVEQRL